MLKAYTVVDKDFDLLLYNSYSEQLFSAAGQIYCDRRSNLIGQNVEKLLFWLIIFIYLDLTSDVTDNDCMHVVLTPNIVGN